MPHLIELYQKHRDEGLQVISITREDAKTAQQFAKSMEIPYPILTDADGAVFERFKAHSIPHTVILDKQGRAAGLAPGYSAEYMRQIRELVAQLLKE